METLNYLDRLPADIINYVIMPYLEWEDRINLNRLIPPGDRAKGTRMSKKQIVSRIKSAVGQGQSIKAVKAVDLVKSPEPNPMLIVPAIIDLLKGFTRGLSIVLIEYDSAFRNTCIQKIKEFTTSHAISALPTEEMRRNMIDVCIELQILLIAYPLKEL